ncbi:MAG: hypothetical protein RIR70_497 [Pseudomonadota bacterium]|jgi:hypothetical protein
MSQGLAVGVTQFVHYGAFEELVLNTGGLYLMFGFGTGDTFNAMIHLRRAPPQGDYEFIIKAPQENLVRFLLGSFEHPPARVHVIPYWKHDFSQQIVMRFPSLPFARGVAAQAAGSGLIDFWQHPFNYQKLIPLEERDIASLTDYFRSQPPERILPAGSVVLFPTAGTNFSEYIPDWPHIAASLKARGFQVFANQSGVADYGSEHIEGAEPINLPHDELIRLFYAGQPIHVVAVRSGVLDILRFSAQKMLVFYQPALKGIFETCRFGLLKHNLDLIELICMNHLKQHQDAMIDFYIDHFIGSSLDGAVR